MFAFFGGVFLMAAAIDWLRAENIRIDKYAEEDL
jgi:hypothetical protein